MFKLQLDEILRVYSKAPKVGLQHVFKAWCKKIDLIGVQCMLKSDNIKKTLAFFKVNVPLDPKIAFRKI